MVIKNAIIGDGSLVKRGARISNSIIGLRSLVGEDCDIADTLMLGSDYYETLDECAFVPGCLPMGIGAGSVVRKVRKGAGGSGAGRCWRFFWGVGGVSASNYECHRRRHTLRLTSRSLPPSLMHTRR